jgi:hypothetical protein
MSLPETKISEIKTSKNKRKLICDNIISKLQKTIVDFRKEESLTNLNEILKYLEENKIISDPKINGKKIEFKFLEPPVYLKNLKNKSGSLTIRRSLSDNSYRLFFVAENCSIIMIKNENIWKEFIDTFVNYLLICNFEICECSYQSKICKKCNEQMYKDANHRTFAFVPNFNETIYYCSNCPEILREKNVSSI